MRLTSPGHREGARVPPEYVDKCWSTLDVELLRDRSYTPHAPKKLSGVCPVCMQHRCPHPAVWFQFGPCRAYLRFSIYHGNFVWSLNPGSDVRLHARFLLLHFCTVTSPRAARRGLEGPTFCRSHVLKRHSSAHIYNNFCLSSSFSRSLGTAPGTWPKAWKGLLVYHYCHHYS